MVKDAIIWSSANELVGTGGRIRGGVGRRFGANFRIGHWGKNDPLLCSGDKRFKPFSNTKLELGWENGGLKMCFTFRIEVGLEMGVLLNRNLRLVDVTAVTKVIFGVENFPVFRK